MWHTALGILQQTAQEPPVLKDRTCRASLPRKTQVLGSEKRAELSSAINCQGSWRAPQACTPHLCQNWVSILPAYHQGNQRRKSVTHPDSESTCSREQEIAVAKTAGPGDHHRPALLGQIPGVPTSSSGMSRNHAQESKREGSSAPGTMTKPPLLNLPQP